MTSVTSPGRSTVAEIPAVVGERWTARGDGRWILPAGPAHMALVVGRAWFAARIG